MATPNHAEKTIVYRAFGQTSTSSELAPVTSQTDGFGRIVHTERTVAGILERADAIYDAADRLSLIRLQGARDKDGNLLPGKADHGFVYDTLGRLMHAQDPDIGPRDMKYDDRNFLIRHKNGHGDVLAFFYDDAGRLTARGPRSDFDNPVTSYAPNDSDYRYSYDSAAAEAGACIARTQGRLTAVDEPGIGDPDDHSGTPARLAKGRVAFCYDSMGRQNVTLRRLDVGRTEEISGWESNKLSPSGLLLSQRMDDGFLLQPSYDAAGRLSQLGDIWRAGTNAAPDTLTGLDGAGRVLLETYGSGVQQTYNRNEVGMPVGIGVTRPPAGGGVPAPGDLLYAVAVTRNLYGAPRVVTDLARAARAQAGLPLGSDHYAKYDYDGAARLIGATMGFAPERQWHFRFQYDGLQNMTGRTQQGPVTVNGVPRSLQIRDGVYRYDGPGPRQLTSVVDGCSGAEATFGYDGAGRMIRDDKKTLNYDGYDQLVSVFEDGNNTSLIASAYGYDGLRTFTRARGESSGQYWFSSAHTRMQTGKRRHFVSVGDRL